MPMTLEKYDCDVAPYVAAIRFHAEALLHNARNMKAQPDFETWAEDALEKCTAELAIAAQRAQQALDEYREKPRDG